MNTITSTAQHPDHGLGAVPSVDLTNGVDLTHQFTFDRHPKLGFFSCHDLAVSALGGLIAARLSQKLVTAADGQDRSKGEEPCVGVTERVEGESSACTNERNGDSGGAHLSGLGFGGAMCHEGLQRDLAFGEVADDQHVFCGHSVVSHLRDPAGRNAELLSEGFVSSCASFKPLFEVHASSLEQPKPLSQGISKPNLFSLDSTAMDELTQHRKKRLEQLIASAPYNGSRQAFMEKAELTKGRISQLLDPSEPFGELAAERLAEKLKLPDLRWFDQGALGAPPMWPFVLLTPEVTLTLNSRNLEIVEKLALHLLAEQKTNIVTNLQRSKLDAPKKRVPIARVKYPSQRTELDVSVIQPAGKPTRKAGRS